MDIANALLLSISYIIHVVQERERAGGNYLPDVLTTCKAIISELNNKSCVFLYVPDVNKVLLFYLCLRFFAF